MTASITVIAKDLYQAQGHEPGDPSTGYLRHWTPALGPTATLLYHDLHHATRNGPVTLQLAAIAASLGLGRGTAPKSILGRGIRRLGYYGLLFPEVGADGVRLYLVSTLPPIAIARQRSRDGQVTKIGAG